MLILTKIGTVFAVTGVGALVAPSVGVVLKGLKPDETRMAGVFLLAMGAVLWVIGFALGKLQDSMDRRTNEKARSKMKVPDDVIK